MGASSELISGDVSPDAHDRRCPLLREKCWRKHPAEASNSTPVEVRVHVARNGTFTGDERGS